MNAFFVAQINIEDATEYTRYLAGYDEVFARYNGRVVAVDDAVTVLEGSWPFSRTVLIEFPTREDCLAWYRSPDYQAIAEHRRRASQANIVVVQGRE